ncbi:hypothetical protein CVT24_000679 [Panaeolus cyanescens]|uniref:Rgp1-domain-containing protein n=1 Tax=Panaeolus cyanescens TaxID=181874 RepID=A0A409VWJ2_9AGAR|nr:hypothetical protein CVT24_000679 [Panaeolus cyanescens]
MPGLVAGDDSPIRVVVTPSQSSYFAGETFAVTVTFTNTRSISNSSGEAGPSRPHSYTHRRGAHSISSAPLARPPTSPGTPRSAVTPAPPRPKPTPDELPRRKGIIGKPKAKPTPTLPNGSDPLPELLEQRRKRQLAHKSLSVSISPYELEDQLHGAVATSSPGSPKALLYDSRTPTTPHIPSPLARTDALPLAASHPHARKQSILDGQFSLDILSPTTSTPPLPSSHPLSISSSYNASSSHPYGANSTSGLGSPYSPTSSASTFSLALDSISEASAAAAALASPYASSLAIGQPSIETPSNSPLFPPTENGSSNVTAIGNNRANGIVAGVGNGNTHAHTPPDGNTVYAYPPRHGQSHHHRPSPIGLGQPSSAPRGYGTAPNTPNPNNNGNNVYNVPYAPYTPKTPTTPSSNRTTSNHYLSAPHQYPKTAFTSSFPSQTSSHELILYAYAQLTGTLQLVPIAGVLPSKDQANTLNWVRRELASSERGVVGGGRMGIGMGIGAQGDGAIGSGGLTPTSAITPGRLGRHRPSHSRTASLSAAAGGLLSMLSPTSIVSTLTAPTPPGSANASGARPSPGFRNSSFSPAAPSGAATPTSARFASQGGPNGALTPSATSSALTVPDVDPEQPLPTFEVQPAMLAVDLVLGPGESRSYTYTIKLPSVLPPTFKGKSLKFSYEFVVGTCRAGSSPSMGTLSPPAATSSPASSTSISRVMKVPIRVYNHVSVERPQGPYDLLWPTARRQQARHGRSGYEEEDVKAKVVEVLKESDEVGSVLSASRSGSRSVSSPSTQLAPRLTHDSIKQYAEGLLQAAAAVQREKMEEAAQKQRLESSSAQESVSNSSPPSLSSSASSSSSSSSAAASSRSSSSSPSSSPLTSTPDHPLQQPAKTATHAPHASDDTITKTNFNAHDGGLYEDSPADRESGIRSPHEEELSSAMSSEQFRPSPSTSRSTSGTGMGNDVGERGGKQGKSRPGPLDLGRTSSEHDEMRSRERERERVDEGGLTGCREAVELLTRNPKKATYDVNKDGVRVALLTFPKTAYRLGETVMGVVEINDKSSRARVLKLSAILESHETLPSSICPPSSGRHLRRSHAEHHSSFTLNSLRTTFSLDIPSDASPAFNIGIGTSSSQYVSPPGRSPNPTSQDKGGLEWKVRLCLLVAIAPETSYKGLKGVRFKSLTREGPRGEWGSSWRATPLYAPLHKRDYKAEARLIKQQQEQAARDTQKSNSTSRSSLASSIGSPVGWGRFLVNSLIFGNSSGTQGLEKVEREYHDGDALGDDDESTQEEDEGSEDEDGNPHPRALGKRVSSFGFLGSSDARDDALGNGLGLGVDPGYDGIVPDPAGGVGVGVDYAGGKDEDWTGVRLETVECEVPVRVYPGNTAFRALDVVFDV